MTLRRSFIPLFSLLLLVGPSPSMAIAQESTPETTTTTVPAAALVEAKGVRVPAKPKKLVNPEPLEAFWDRLAYCETNSEWDNGGNWAGGLGIARSTWTNYGGYEFGRTPDRATREEQIIVAKRIALYGYQTKNKFRTLEDAENNKPWFQRPVGFGGWGALPCAGGKPHLMKYEASTVIVQKFKWHQRGRLVKDLQAIVGAPLTAIYDERTWGAHNAYLVKHGMDRSLAPRPKLKRATGIPAGNAKKCSTIASQAHLAGFPAWELDTVAYVAWKESRCQPDAINARDENGGSFGLMQINNVWTRRLIRDGVIKSRNDLMNQQKNLEAAFYVWNKNIQWSRFGWKAWGLSGK